MAFCKHCGNKLENGAKFCPKCGKPTNGDAPKSDGNDKNYEDTKNSTEKTSDEEKVETKSGFKKYLPYILSVIVLLGIIGYFNSKNFKGKNDSQSQLHNTENDAVIANYDEGMVYQGEYIFDAVLTDAAMEKTNSTFTIKIDGNNVTSSMDEGKDMSGHIYSDDLGIEAVYDYGDDLHWISFTIKPNDKEGKEWVGEFAFTGRRFDAVLKLKECKQQGKAIKVTKERETDDDNEKTADDNTDNSSSTFNSSNTSSYSKYVGRWILRKTTDGGNRMRIEVTLKDNKSGENVVFAEHGNRAEVLVYEEYQQCILNDGVIYLTKDGDINGKGVPKLRVASDGLYSFDGAKFTRKSE